MIHLLTALIDCAGKEKTKMMEPGKDSLDLGIVVSDINASLNFYQNILGLKFIEERPATSGTMYRLRFGTSDFKVIKPFTIPAKGPVGIPNQLGFRYVTFIVKNLSEICEQLKSKGVEFVMPLKESRPGTRLAMVKDPDGNIVEFVQRS